MHVPSLPVVFLALAACDPCDSDPQLCETGVYQPPPPDDEEPAFNGRVGLGVVSWYGEFDLSASGLRSTYGLGVVTDDLMVACVLYGEQSGGGTPPDGCPDCNWAYSVERVGGGTAGDHCEDWVDGVGTLFEYDYDAVWWGTESVTAWGMATSYTYWYDGEAFPLENALFVYYEELGWYLRHYDIPGDGVDQVREEGDPLVVVAPLVGEGNYYYVYYFNY